MRSGSSTPGSLHQDAVLALALDRRLAHAGLVDAAAHDLDRLLERGDPGVGRRLLRQRQPRGAVPVDLDRGLRVERFEHAPRPLDVGRVADFESDLAARGAQPAIADPRPAQALAGRVHDALQPLGDHHVQFDLQQQVGAALQVEAEAHLLAGREVRHGVRIVRCPACWARRKPAPAGRPQGRRRFSRAGIAASGRAVRSSASGEERAGAGRRFRASPLRDDLGDHRAAHDDPHVLGDCRPPVRPARRAPARPCRSTRRW